MVFVITAAVTTSVATIARISQSSSTGRLLQALRRGAARLPEPHRRAALRAERSLAAVAELGGAGDLVPLEFSGDRDQQLLAGVALRPRQLDVAAVDRSADLELAELRRRVAADARPFLRQVHLQFLRAERRLVHRVTFTGDVGLHDHERREREGTDAAHAFIM